MNPFHPHFAPSFTVLSQNPNPNPNFSYSFNPISEPLPPNPSSSTASSSASSSSSNLDNPLTTLSILKNLIDHATETLISASDLLHSGAALPTQNDDFCSCPFDRRHRMPPESLFRHFLRCPSSPGGVVDLDGDGVLESLHYPKTLKSEDELRKENRFVQPLQESDADLCFSLDEYGDFGSNFFYRGCPAVVCSSEINVSNRTFTLPGVLSVHCANFIRDGVGEFKGLNKEGVRILPSELWAVRNEIEVWNDYPCSYSFSVLQVALYLPMIKERDALKWIISNSPHYGVVIDVPMRDHIYIVLRLCLRAISFEASRSSELLRSRVSIEGVGNLNRKSLSFSCPVLVEVLTWFTSQLSVLYGETSGRFFAINLLKHCMLNAMSGLLLYLSDEKKTELSESTDGCGKLDSSATAICPEFVGVEVNKQGKIEELTDKNLFSGGSRRNGLIFVSQVAAAIAALHERSLLEEKIKGLRHAGSLSKSQMISEHAYVTKKADEVRKGRPNYRPILEYDGLLWSRSHNEDSSKMKTKEELLAEERDYKRRRMSYRGKKVKRKITEVMRDIIEEHMEEIKQAGGIGCSVKGGAAEGVVVPSGPVSVREMNADVELKNLGFNSSEMREVQKSDHRKSLHSNNLSPSLDNANLKDRQRRESHGHYEPPDVHLRSARREKRDLEYRSRSPENYRSHGHSQERHRHHRERDERKMTRTKYDENKRFEYHDNRSSSSMSNFSNDFSDEKYDEVPQAERQYRSRRDAIHRSEYVTKSVFEDRYDPSESYYRYDDTYNDISSGNKYARADKSYKSKR